MRPGCILLPRVRADSVRLGSLFDCAGRPERLRWFQMRGPARGSIYRARSVFWYVLIVVILAYVHCVDRRHQVRDVISSNWWLTFWRIRLEGISSTMIPKNINWFPRLTVLWSMCISLPKPPVKALAIFMRSNWNTVMPNSKRGRTERSILYTINHCPYNQKVNWDWLSPRLSLRHGTP